MCGISGIFNFDGSEVEYSAIEKMNRLIRHRGPDGEGVYTEGNIGLGSTRLSIIDLREISNMPMFDYDNRYVIVYNGEIFNYPEVREELLKKGYKFKNNSDTEVILNAYREYGEECLHKLNGMWAFAIWDKKDKTLFCARDRYGIKPFYYYKDSHRFIFGSEIKQIIDFKINKGINDEIIYDFLIFNFVDHTPETFFKYIHKLPSGFKISIREGNFRISPWYRLEENIDDDLRGEKLYKQFYELLYDSVRLRLRSDVEVGSCLSGGLDSSSIVCIMHDILHDEGKPEIQKTYTACYDVPEIDERKYVEEVIKQTNSTKYYLFPNSQNLQEDMNRMFYHQDEPFNGLSIYAQYCVFKKINETKLKVVLDGQGSDEILLGYFSFYPFYLKRLVFNPFLFLREFVRGADTSGLGINKFFQNLVYFNYPRFRLKHVKRNAAKFLRKGYINYRNRRELFDRLISGTLSDNRFSNLWNISLQSLLRYEDKNSMAYSVEARLPFLDHRLVELIFRMPYDELIKDGWTKYVLRQSMKNCIPEDIRMRKGKLAFSVPQKLWMEQISKYLRESFTNGVKAIRYIDTNKILSAIKTNKYNDKVLFRVFALEKWMEVFDLK